MSEYISKRPAKRFNVSTQRFGLEDPLPAMSDDLEEIAYRKTLRGTGALVYEQEARGVDVLSWALAQLEGDKLAQGALAEIGSSAMYVSAGYHLRDDENTTMDHFSALPWMLDEHDKFITPAHYSDDVFKKLAGVSRRIQELAPLKKERRLAPSKSVRLGSQMGSAAAFLANFPSTTYSDELDSIASVQHGIKVSAIEARDRVIDIARESDGVAPSLIQFADRTSKASLYILRARRHGNLPTPVKEAYRASLDFHNAA